MSGEVTFVLHPTFRPDLRRVTVSDNVAAIQIKAWGAFTVGAVCDEGATRLELDLAEMEGVDPVFSRGKLTFAPNQKAVRVDSPPPAY